MLKPGHILGNRYQILKPLGQGGQSNVYLINDTRLKGKRWVAKEMVAQYAEPRERSLAQKHFEQEANLLATLDHVHLPKVMDYFADSGKYYLIMEYLEGEDLGRALDKRKTPFTEEQVANWSGQIATVLYYLHNQKPPVVFRDIKPSNIMLCGGQVKLIDFGIARHFNPVKKGDTLRIGSPGYSPPEQYSGQTDPRSDIYSLGVTMHHLLTNQDPSKSQTPFKLAPIKLFNTDVSPKMIYIVEKATNIDPNKRYQNALDMKKDLREVLQPPNLTQMVPPTVSPTAPYSPVSMTVPVPPPSPVAVTQLTPAPPPPTEGSPLAPDPSQSGAVVQDKSPSTADMTLPPAQGTSTPLPAVKKGNPRGVIVALLVFLILGVSLYGGYNWVAQNMDKISSMVGLSSPVATPSSTPHAVENTGNPLETGIAYYQQGEYRKAVNFLERARTEKPGDPIILILRNNALAKGSRDSWLSFGAVYSGEDGSSENFLRGVALAQTRINSEGGILQKKLVINLYPIEDKEKLSYFVSHGNQAVVSVLPAEGLPALLKESSDKIPFVFLSAGGDKSWGFFWTVSPDKEDPAYVEGIGRMNVKNLLLVYDSQESERQLRVSQLIEEKKIPLVKAVSYQREKMDFEPVIQEIKDKNPDMIAVIGKPENISTFIKILRQKTVNNKIVLPPGMVTDSFLDSLGENIKGLYGVSGYYGGGENFPARNFAVLYENRYNSLDGDGVSAGGYDGVNFLCYSARNSFGEGDKMLEFLKGSGVVFNGVTGNYSSDGGVIPPWWGLTESDGKVWKPTAGFSIIN